MEKPQGSSSYVVESKSVQIVEEDDEFWALSGKPYFDMVFTKTHLRPSYQMNLTIKLRQYVTSAPDTIPAVLTRGRSSWKMVYRRGSVYHSFCSGWRAFADDNGLKKGDAIIFEQSECSASELKFRVQILRYEFPSELLRKTPPDDQSADGETSDEVEDDGETPETAITIA